MSVRKGGPVSAGLYSRLRKIIAPFGSVEAQIPQECLMVDIGCGFGVFANYVAVRSSRRKVLGIDNDQKRILAAKKAYQNVENLSFVCGDVTQMDVPKTDIVTLVDVLHHIPEHGLQARLVESCFDALSDGGTILVKDVDTKPSWKYWWNRVHDHVMTGGMPVLYKSQAEIKALLADAGFEIGPITEIGGYPYAHVMYAATKPG